MSVICIFGDSITWGAWDLEFGGWVSRLRLHFDKKDNYETDVYNCGVDGDYVGDVLKRIDSEAQARNPDIIILAIGINDTPHASNPSGTALGNFDNQFKQLLEKAAKHSKKIIILGLTNVDEKRGNHGYKNNEISKYNDKIKLLAENINLSFIDLFGNLPTNEFEDGLHPNAKGHQKIFEKVKEIL